MSDRLAESDPKDEAQRRLNNCGIDPKHPIYRHYKGGLYTVVTLAIKEDTLEPMVIYRSNKYGTVYARTLENWSEVVANVDGKTRARFTRVEG